MSSTIKATISGMDVTISSNNINIKDSHLIWNPIEMRNILNAIQEFMKENNITMDIPFNHRSKCSMIREWIAHNNAYTIGYKRERTGSVDLNFPQKWYVKVLYFFLSLFIL